jgi:hypothetical protein
VGTPYYFETLNEVMRDHLGFQWRFFFNPSHPIGRSMHHACPPDTQACPACGHFFSPRIEVRCVVCQEREKSRLAEEASKVHVERASVLAREVDNLRDRVRNIEGINVDLGERLNMKGAEANALRESNEVLAMAIRTINSINLQRARQ